MKKLFILFTVLLLNSSFLFSQVAINTDGSAAANSAMLDVKSTSKGFLPPRMTHAELNAIANPVDGLIVYCTDCGSNGTGTLSMFTAGSWYSLSANCINPLSPVTGTHVASSTQIVWNWNAVTSATGYKWNTANDYGTATDMGTVTAKTETGLTCGTAYTRYVWAYSACGNSISLALSQTTSACAVAPTVTTDPANNATGVLLNKVIVATFSVPMDSLTLKTPASNFTIKQGTTLVTGKFSYTSNTASFTPTSNLAPWTVYTGTITTGVKNTLGTPMAADYVWSFTTIPQLTLSSLPALGGTTSGAGLFAQGSSVTVIATANAGFTFFNWTDGVTVASTSATYQLTMAGNKTLVANFTPKYVVTVLSNPLLGGITTGGGTFNSGASVTVNAVANAGYTFTNWTESGTAVSTTASYTFTISGNRTLVANYTSTSTAVTVTDIDGNVYNTVTIGTQVWMAENLKTSRYRNGDAIPNVTVNTAWGGLTTGAYCNYNNDAANAAIYGKLYNWYAATDARNIAPTGWHVPSDAEWTTLTTFLGGESVAGGKLKETGTSHWSSPNTGATNETGFTAFPGGYRFSSGTFSNVGNNGNWWSSAEYSSSYAWHWRMFYDTSSVYRDYCSKQFGFSVRCVRDF